MGAPDDPASTIDLVERARAGDREAVERLCRRYLPRLRVWARGRLPERARDLLDTDDLAQEVLLRTVRRVEADGPPVAGFHAYVRQALKNRIRDEIRRVQRRPEHEEIEEEIADDAASPLDGAVGRENLARYERALARLKDEEREAIIARLELRLGYEEIAEALGKPSVNAARMTVVRAMEKLLGEMDDA